MLRAVENFDHDIFDGKQEYFYDTGSIRIEKNFYKGM
jgi:hypothetical protein